MSLSLAWYVFVFFWQAWWQDWVLCPTHMFGLLFHSYFAFLYFVSVSLFLSVLVFFLTILMVGLSLMSNWHIESLIVNLRFCIFVSVSLFLSVLVFFDKPDGGTESDVHPTCWVWDEGGVEATFPLNFVIIVIWITTNHNSSCCWNHLSPIPIVFGYSHHTSK